MEITNWREQLASLNLNNTEQLETFVDAVVKNELSALIDRLENFQAYSRDGNDVPVFIAQARAELQ